MATKRQIVRTLNKLAKEATAYYTSSTMYSPEFKWSLEVCRKIASISAPPAKSKKGKTK